MKTIKLTKLDKLVDDVIFDRTQARPFSTDKAANQFLRKWLQQEGFVLNLVDNHTYFYCDLAKGDIEVSADSRANVRPRTLLEAVCVAALKFHLGDNEKAWDKLLVALDIDKSKLKY